MVDTRQFANEPNKELLGVDGTLQLNSILARRYRVSGVLGVGGMGSVYQARDMQFDKVERFVAVKEMLNVSQQQEMREISRANFEREANILASLAHPALPAIYDFFSIQDRAYIVMEYINGKNLEVILQQVEEPLPLNMTLDWAIELCDVLHYLHTRTPPIIFRDMKPANIMIDSQSRLRLIDFGIARVFEHGEKMTMIGTEGYSAPEQYRGEATPQSDLYGLGATLHHLLTEEDPRLHVPFTFADRAIHEYNPGIPSTLEAIVMKALAYDPEQRFETALLMKEQLMKARDNGRAPSVGSPGEEGSQTRAIDDDAFAQTLPEDDWGEAATAGQEVRWKFRVEEEIRSSVIVHDSTVFVGSYDTNLWALNASSGDFRWKFATKEGIATTPDIDAEKQTVVIGSDDGHVYSIDIRSGRVNWKLETKGPVRSSPNVIHGHVFFGSDDGVLYAVRITTGRVAWRYDAGVPIRSRPLVTDEIIITGTESGDVYALDLSGQLKWRFTTKRSVMSSPIVHDGIAYFGSNDYHLYAVDIKNGWSVWRFRAGKPIVSSPVMVEDEQLVVFGSADGYVYALDAFSGKEKWKFQTGNQVIGSPVYANEAIYVGSVDGNVYSLDPKRGKERWRFETGGPITGAPYIVDGTMYIGSTDNIIYAVKA
jgi:eukaryotic-like serine/threonine-protein kinase